jgi:hypothetical protein
MKPDRDLVRVRRVFEVFAHDHELVSRQPRHAVTGPQHRGQPISDRDQQLITDPLTVGVIDQLELVKIQEEHRRRETRATPRKRACSNRSNISTRFGRPVSASCNAASRD